MENTPNPEINDKENNPNEEAYQMLNQLKDKFEHKLAYDFSQDPEFEKYATEYARLFSFDSINTELPIFRFQSPQEHEEFSKMIQFTGIATFEILASKDKKRIEEETKGHDVNIDILMNIAERIEKGKDYLFIYTSGKSLHILSTQNNMVLFINTGLGAYNAKEKRNSPAMERELGLTNEETSYIKDSLQTFFANCDQIKKAQAGKDFDYSTLRQIAGVDENFLQLTKPPYDFDKGCNLVVNLLLNIMKTKPKAVQDKFIAQYEIESKQFTNPVDHKNYKTAFQSVVQGLFDEALWEYGNQEK